jgi:hypothetical protein
MDDQQTDGPDEILPEDVLADLRRQFPDRIPTIRYYPPLQDRPREVTAELPNILEGCGLA